MSPASALAPPSAADTVNAEWQASSVPLLPSQREGQSRTDRLESAKAAQGAAAREGPTLSLAPLSLETYRPGFATDL